MAGRFTSETAAAFGKKGGSRSRKYTALTVEEVERELGTLDSIEDAKRWLNTLAKWGAANRLPGAVLSGTVRAVEVWVKADAEGTAQAVKEELEGRIRDLEKRASRPRVA